MSLKALAAGFALAVLIISPALAKGGAISVGGYFRSNGTYVAPHLRTAPDSTRYNNWSSKPNVNPYTGKPGTVDPNAPKPPRTTLGGY